LGCNMAISKKLRFEVFKRDGFVCCYCGKTPPAVILEIDHINPKSKGGKDHINNLITACFDCNRGKSNIPLDKIPSPMTTNLEILKEKESQLRQYNNWVKRIEKRIEIESDEISEVFAHYYKGWHLSDSFKERTVKRFLKYIPISSLKENMHNACGRDLDKDSAVRYFCGICWKQIKEPKNGQSIH
jgi:hypothetical protein